VHVAVIVVTWNSAAVLPRLFASFEAGLAGLDRQVIVVDNDSADDSVAVARRELPAVRIVQTGRNAGYAAAINAGLAAADRYDAVLVLNPDIQLGPGCGAALAARLGVDGTGIAVPLIRDENGAVARSLRREPTLGRAVGEAVLGHRAGRYPALGETILDDAAYRSPTTVDWATGAIMLVSAACQRACGPWDERFFLYSEETEFALRARDLGFRTRLVPEAVAVHKGGESSVSPRLWSLLTVNRVRLYRLRHSRPATAAYWAAVLLRESARAALGKPRSRRAAAALLGLARTP
jgi:N-acetylglucosaminyl-diphospho-decaprenol L-rhamnosyltransferase